jgi:hypothetical protein
MSSPVHEKIQKQKVPVCSVQLPLSPFRGKGLDERTFGRGSGMVREEALDG